MGRVMSMTMMVVVAATAVMLAQVVMAKTLTVGDGNWVVPASLDFYSSWAAKQSFAVGDILEFKFNKPAHTVAQVTLKDAYENCDASLDPNAKIYESTTEVTLTKEGPYYFFCTIGSHCAQGQKLSITVSSTALPTAPTTAAQPPPLSPMSPDSSAIGISAFPVSFMAIIMSLAVLARVIT